MQGEVSNAFNEFLRRPMLNEFPSNPELRPLLCVAAIMYDRPSTLYVYDSYDAYGPVMRTPSTRGVHQDCALGAMCFAIVAYRAHQKMDAIAPDEPIVRAYSDDGYFLGPPTVVVAIGEAMPSAYASVGLTVTIHKTTCIPFWGSG
jgi:hypothetical protein